MTTTASDIAAIEEVVHTFFSAFRSGPDAAAQADRIRQVVLPEAVIVRTCGRNTETYSVERFIEPRVALLGSGALRDFREWMTDARIDVFGDIAQVWCWYAKSWSAEDGEHFERGMKSSQLVRTDEGWRISGLVWDDERPGLSVPPAPRATPTDGSGGMRNIVD